MNLRSHGSDTMRRQRLRGAVVAAFALIACSTPSKPNPPPVADAGLDRVTLVGSIVTLDGGSSYGSDETPLAFSWRIITRPTSSDALLVDANEQRPSLRVDAPGVYIVELTVSQNGVSSSPDFVNILAREALAIEWTVPPDGATAFPTTGSVAIRFSRPIQTSTLHSGTLALSSGAGQVRCTVGIESDRKTVTLVPTEPLTADSPHRLVISQGISDTAAVTLSQPVVVHFSTTATDTSAPTVVAREPSGVGTQGSPVRVVFSEPIDPATIDATSLSISDGANTIQGTRTLRAAGSLVQFVPDAPWTTGASYTVTISDGITDVAGNSLSPAPDVFSFSVPTEPDVAPPRVAATSPGRGFSDVGLGATVLVFFSEAITGIDGASLTLTEEGGATVAGSVSRGDDWSFATFVPYARLPPDTTFVLTATDAITDLAGNALDGDGNGTAGGSFVTRFVTARPDGETGTVVVPPTIRPGQTVPIEITDADLDSSPLTDSVDVTVISSRGESETVSLTETGPTSGILAGTLQTAFEDAPPGLDDDGTIVVWAGDTITISYEDVLGTDGSPATVTEEVGVVGGINGSISVVSAPGDAVTVEVRDADDVANLSSATGVLSCGTLGPCVGIGSPTTGDFETLPLLVEGSEGVFTVDVPTRIAAIAEPGNDTLELAGAGSVVVTYVDALRANGDPRGVTIEASTAIALDSIVIRDAPFGEGNEIGALTISTDDQVRLYAAGYDDQGTYLGDQSVNWTVTGQIGSISSTGAAADFDPTTVGFGQISATHPDPTVTGDDTGLIEVTPGAIAAVVVVTAPGDTGLEVTNLTLTTDEVATFYSAGFDADGNYVADASVNWSVLGGIGRVTPTVGTSTQFDPTAVGSGTVRARSGSAAIDLDETGTITVVGGAIDSIEIYEQIPDGPLSPLEDRTITADETLALCAASYDADGNYLGDTGVDWTVLGGIGAAAPAFGSCTTFAPGLAGDGQVRASSSQGGVDTSGLITVAPGALASIVLRDAPGGGGGDAGPRVMTTDATLTVYAAGYDTAGNYLGDQDVTWSVVGQIGTIAPSTGTVAVFDPTTPGSGSLSALYVADGLSAGSGTISVSEGALAAVRIQNDACSTGTEIQDVTINTDGQLALTAVGLDADGNCRGPQTVTWTVLGNVGAVTPVSGSSTVFDPRTVGLGAIRASAPGASSDDTGAVTVTVGALATLDIQTAPAGAGVSVGSVSIDVGNQLGVYAAGFDGDGNRLPADPTVDWSVIGSVGSLNPSVGSSTVFTAAGTVAATGQIHAVSGAIQDDSGTITLTTSFANLDHVRIYTRAGCDEGDPQRVEVGDLSIDTDQTVTDLHAIGFDSSSNCLGDVSVTWSVNQGGTLDPGPNTSTVFDPTTPSTTTVITANHATAVDDATGTITIIPGALATIVVRNTPGGGGTEIEDLALTADDTVSLHAAGYDADGNYLGEQAVDWSLDQPVGAFLGSSTGVASVTLDLTRIGSGVVTADHATPGVQDDTTGILTVNAGALARVRIDNAPAGTGTEVDTRQLTADETLTLHCVGLDADGNFVADQSVLWTIATGAIGTLAAGPATNTLFDATTVGTGTIRATHSSVGSDDTGAVTVNAGILKRITLLDGAAGSGVQIGARTLSTDQTQSLFAAGFDADGNFIGDQADVDWSVTGGIGLVAPPTGASATFDAQTIGTGAVVADYVGTVSGVIDGSTGTLTIVGGLLADIVIRDAPSGGGVEVAALSMTADDQLTLYAAGFDADGNYLGDQSVAWSVTNSIGSLSSAVAPSTVFFADVTGSGVISATGAGFADDTGLVTVVPGALSRIRVRDAAGGGGAEVGDVTLTADDTLPLYAAGYDGDDNFTGGVSLTWVVSGGIGIVSPVSGSMTVFDARTVGAGSVIADHPVAIDGGTGTVTVTPGALDSVLIRSQAAGAGVEVGDITLVIAEDRDFFAAGYDGDGNFIADEAVDWALSITTGPLSGTLSAATGTSTTLTPDAEGEASLTASHGTASGDSTGLLTVVGTTAPVVTGVSPDTSVRNQLGFQASIDGSNFDCGGAGPAVNFLPSGQIAVASVDACTSTRLDVTLDIPCGATLATYDVLITNPGGQFGIGAAVFTVTTAQEGPYGDVSCSNSVDDDCDGQADAADVGCAPPTWIGVTCPSPVVAPGPTACTIELDGVPGQESFISCTTEQRVTSLFYDPFDDFSQWSDIVSGTPQIGVLPSGNAAMAESLSGATVSWEVERHIDTRGMDRVCLDFRFAQRRAGSGERLRVDFDAGSGNTRAFELDFSSWDDDAVRHDDPQTGEADWFNNVCLSDIDPAAADNADVALRLSARAEGGRSNNPQRVFVDEMVMTGMAGTSSSVFCDDFADLSGWTVSGSGLSIRSLDSDDLAATDEDGDAMERCFDTTGLDIVDMSFNFAQDDRFVGHRIGLELSVTGPAASGGSYSPVLELVLDDQSPGSWTESDHLYDYFRLLRLSDLDPGVANNSGGQVCVRFVFNNGDPGESRWLYLDDVCVGGTALDATIGSTGTVSDLGDGSYSVDISGSQPATLGVSCTWSRATSSLDTDCAGGNSCPADVRFLP